MAKTKKAEKVVVSAKGMMQTRIYTIKGIVALMMNNGRMRNPLDPVVKEIRKYSKKRNKTDDDLAEIARLEWHGALYANEGKQVIVPGINIQSMLRNAAKKNKLGKQFRAGVFCYEDPVLKYNGPADIGKLWEDERFRNISAVKLQGRAIMRCRPIFPEWELTFCITYNTALVNPEEIDLAMEIAGMQIGLCEWIPEHGRFEVKSIT